MRPTLSLLWKEYREQRWFFVAALAIFCGFPLVEATGRYLRPPASQPGFPASTPVFYSDAAAGMVLGFGGLLAIFVAIGSTTRDLHDELHVFWRSRPIGVGAWMGVKFAAGLATVLTACTIPMLMQFAMAASRGRFWSVTEVGGTIGIHSFALVLIFSVAFLLGCLLRHATHAALLALAVAMVIYFLPVVVPALAPLSVFNLMNEQAFQLERNVTPNPAGWTFFLPVPGRYRVLIEPMQWSIFVAAMLGGSIAAAALALVAVRRDWRVAADRRAMHWSLGGVAMLLFGATAFQVGSNLKVQRQFDLPLAKHAVVNMAFDGRRGAVLLRDTTDHRYYGQTNVTVCSVETSPDGTVRYGPVIKPRDTMNVPYAWYGGVLFYRPERPDRAHLLYEHSGYVDRKTKGHNYEVTLLQLVTIDLTGASADPVVHRLDLLPLLPGMQSAARTHVAGDRIFIAGGDNVVAVDLSNADEPRVGQKLDVTTPGPNNAAWRLNTLWQGLDEVTDGAGRTVVTTGLPPLEGLSPRERLAARLSLGLANQRHAVDGDLLVSADQEAVSTYRLLSIDAQGAMFERVGRLERTPLERLVGSYPSKIIAFDGRAYVLESRMGNGVSVYDLRDAARPTSVGHFATHKTLATVSMARLASGELLLAADRLYVLAPPSRVVK